MFDDFGSIEAYKVLDRASKLLNSITDERRIKAADLSLVRLNETDPDLLYTKQDKEEADRLIIAEGLDKSNMPVHIYELKQERLMMNIGLTLYKMYDTKIHYVILNKEQPGSIGFDGTASLATVLIIETSQLPHFLNKIKTNSQRDALSAKPPLLKEGMLEEIISGTIGFLDNQKEFKRYNLKPTRGLLFNGEPGNGKSMVCKWLQKLAVERGYETRTISASDIDNAYGSSSLKRLLDHGDLIFFDDVDVSYLSRDQGKGERACDLLSALNGIETTKTNVRIFATNEEVDNLDPAFTRSGRIDKKFKFDIPNRKLRKKVLDLVWHKEISDYVAKSNLVEYYLDETEDLSFADLNNIQTTMVMKKIVDGASWDLKAAIATLKLEQQEKGEKKVIGLR